MASDIVSEITKKLKLNENKIYNKPYLIGISGGSGGGKTSVANLIHRSLGRDNSLLFSMDTYYKDLTPEQEKDLSNYNFDTPDALDLDLLYEHLNDLMNWKDIQMPTYDFSTNKRLEQTIKLEPHKVIIFEGILAFYDERMRNLMDLKLFIDLDDDIRLSRRIYRDIISRGRQMETVLERYHKFVKTAYNNYIKPTKEYADIIIPRGGSNTIAIDLINYHLKYIIGNYIFKNDKGEIVGEKKEEKEDKNKGKTWYVEGFYSDEIIKGLQKEDVFDEDSNHCLIKNEEKDMFLDMFKNYLKNENFQYFDIYMDIYTKKIKDVLEKDDLIILSNDDLKKIETLIQEKIKNNKNETFQVFYYIPIFFRVEKKFISVFNYLSTIKEISLIKIISVFVSEKNVYQYISDNRIKYQGIYNGKKIQNYYVYIENYGFYSKTDDENVNNLISFSEDNFERRLLELIERDKKKDNLSIINNYQEDEE